MRKKNCKDLKLVAFNKARRWIKMQAKECKPVNIEKYGGRSKYPFHTWVFADVILSMSNEHARMQSQYVLSAEKWNAFCKYVKEHPDMTMSELASRFKDFGCTNKLFWPAVISISKAVLQSL